MVSVERPDDAITKNIREIASGIRMMEEAHALLVECVTRELEKMRSLAETYSLLRLPLRSAIEDLKGSMESDEETVEFHRRAVAKCMESLGAAVAIYDAGNEDIERINRDHMAKLEN